MANISDIMTDIMMKLCSNLLQALHDECLIIDKHYNDRFFAEQRFTHCFNSEVEEMLEMYIRNIHEYKIMLEDEIDFVRKLSGNM